MGMKNIASDPNIAWGPAGKCIVVGEIFYKGWYLVQRIVAKLNIK